MNIIKVNNWNELPKNFTGIAEFLNGNKYWYKEGNCHRSDGPAIERLDKSKEWWVDGQLYLFIDIEVLIETSIYLGKEKGKYDLDWLRFLTDEGIEEFPIIPGMEEDKEFKPLFN